MNYYVKKYKINVNNCNQQIKFCDELYLAWLRNRIRKASFKVGTGQLQNLFYRTRIKNALP